MANRFEWQIYVQTLLHPTIDVTLKEFDVQNEL